MSRGARRVSGVTTSYAHEREPSETDLDVNAYTGDGMVGIEFFAAFGEVHINLDADEVEALVEELRSAKREATR